MVNVLVACEESQRVCIAFRERGHRAFSCDIEPCSGGHPEWHIQGDVLPLLNGNCTFQTADTHTHTSGAVGFDYSASTLHISFKCCYKAIFSQVLSTGKSCCEVGEPRKERRSFYANDVG